MVNGNDQLEHIESCEKCQKIEDIIDYILSEVIVKLRSNQENCFNESNITD